MTRGNHWQTLPWLNWRHPIGRQVRGWAESPLGRFTALSTPDISSQSEQPLAAYLLGYPIPAIEELRAAFSPETSSPLRFSLVAQEQAKQPFGPAKTEVAVAPAIAPPSPLDKQPTASDDDLPDLPPPLPTVQRQPLGHPAPLGRQVAEIAEAISGDLPGTPPPNINRPKIPSNDRPALPDGNLPLPDATEQPLRVPIRWPEANRHNPASNLSPSEVLSPPAHSPETETAADSGRPDRPSSETPAAGSPPTPPISDSHSGIAPPSARAAPPADTPAQSDVDDAGVIQPRSDQSQIPPPAIAAPRSFHDAPDADTTTLGDQAPSRAWTGDSRLTDSFPDPADTLEPLNPEHDTSTDAPEGADATDTAKLTHLAALPPLQETADSNSNMANKALPVAPALSESPISEHPSDIEARSQSQLPSTGETTSPPPSSPAEPMQLHSSIEAGTPPPVAKAAIANPQMVDPGEIAPTTDSTQTPASPSLPKAPDLPAQSIGADSPSDALRNATPDDTLTPPVNPTNSPPPQIPGQEYSRISPPQNESLTAPKIPLMPNLQRYMARADGAPSPRSPLAELSDYLVLPTSQLTPLRSPVPPRPKSPVPEQSSDRTLASPPSTPSAQRQTVPTHPPTQQTSRPPTLPVQMRTLESPTASTWEPQFDQEPDFPELEPADFSLDDLEPDDLTAEAEPAADENPGPAATSESEATADSEAVTLTADVGGAEADAELLDHLAEWIYGELRSHLCLRREAQFGQSVALPLWYPQHPGLATQTARSEQNLPSLPLPPTLHQLTTVVRQQVESRLRQDWERFPEYRHTLRF